MPVLAPLRDLFPGGALQRGWVIATGGDGATSLALAIAAGPSAAGSWTAVVGEEGLGLPAAAEAGVVLERLLMVATAEPRAAAEAVAALAGAVDIVLVGAGIRLGAADQRRLAARLRERGSVLIHPGGAGLGGKGLGGKGLGGAGLGGKGLGGKALGGAGLGGKALGGEACHGADVRLQVVSSRWSGLGDGWGLLRARRVSVRAEGRGAASRPRSLDLLLPGPDGAPVLAEDRSDRLPADAGEPAATALPGAALSGNGAEAVVA